MKINYDRLVDYIYNHYITILLLSVFLALASGYFAIQLMGRINTDNAGLLPQDYISVRELSRIKERVGGIGPLMVIITGEELDKSVDFLHVLADSLESNPLISSVSRGKNPEFIKRNRLLYMDLEDLNTIYSRLDDYIELQKYKQSPLYLALDDEEEEELDFSDIEAKYSRDNPTNELGKNYYLTKEENGIILRVYPNGLITDVKFTDALLRTIDRTIVAIDPKRFHPSIECTPVGSFKNANEQYKLIKSDLQSTALWAFLGVLVLISIYFRQILSPFIIVLPLLFSISWTFGVTYLVIGNLNQITVTLFAVLFGLGIDFGIHIFARYFEARRRSMEVLQALGETVCQTGRALTTTATTTTLAFFALLFTDFKGFSEFGFIVGIGIAFSLVAMLITCPAFIVLAERLQLMRLHLKDIPAYLSKRGPYPKPILTLALGLMATAYSVYHINEVGFEYDFHKLRPKKSQIKAKASLPETLKETRSPAIVLTESFEEAQEVVQTVKKIKESNGKSSTIKSVKSVYSALPHQQEDKVIVITRIRKLVNDSENFFDESQRARIDSLRPSLEAKLLTLKDLPTDITNKFTSKDGEILNFVMINAAVPLRDGENAMRFADEVGTIHTPSGSTYHASSAHIIFAEMLRLMLKDSTKAISLTLLVVTAVLFFDLRRVFDTLLVLTPLLTGLAWVAGFMYFFGIKMNAYNIVAFPTIIGMGIDNGVHIFHRFREAGPGSMRLVLRTTGMALAATSLTTMLGFACLVPASHPAVSSIGIVSLIGLGCCFVTSVTLLPALLQLREKQV